jgi:hypothetical protein
VIRAREARKRAEGFFRAQGPGLDLVFSRILEDAEGLGHLWRDIGCVAGQPRFHRGLPHVCRNFVKVDRRSVPYITHALLLELGRFVAPLLGDC